VQQWHIVMIVPIGFSLMFLRFAQVLVRVIQDKQIGFGGHGEVEDAIKLAEETEAKR
jgi:C4-dicarboxylate transporter DctQ subunit